MSILAILLLGFALRAAPLLQNRFHPDEALYATFARLIASGRDPMLSTVVVDKPPLPFYLMAAGMSAFGGAEFAARVPTLFASIVSIALLYALGRTLYDRRTAALGALALALSPLAILFAITLFTDTLLAAFVLWALLMAARGRWRLAGLAVGLAFACKQTALFFVPLVLAVGVIQFIHHREHRGYGGLYCKNHDLTAKARPRPHQQGRRAQRISLVFLRVLSAFAVQGGFFQWSHGGNRKNSVLSALSAVMNFLWPVLLCAAAVFLWDA
ncbi:MAG: glycosyltransferase family 39 protein, partial [Chloroflexi bacterium]|nr:glycosyltransferase family 39 protein [Chloroflexota bacterium]